MIISHHHKFLFIEVPNTACTAIRRVLSEHCGGKVILHKHATYADFRRVAGKEEQKYFVFAGVRNPLDATVSQYIKRKNNKSGRFTDPKRFGTWSVTKQTRAEFEYVQSGASFADFLLKHRNYVFNNFYLLEHQRFDHLIRYERLQADFDEVLRRIGFGRSLQIPVVNQTPGKKPYASYYPPEVRQAAMRIFGPFMNKWGYDFPEGWGPVKVPWASAVRFKSVDLLATLSAGYLKLAPNSHGKAVGFLRSSLRRIWG